MDLDLRVRELAASLVDAGPAPTQPFGTYVIAGTDPIAELGRHVEREVFYEYFGNTPDLLAQEYERYEVSSIFLVVVDHRRLVPAGAMRLIVPNPAGQKSTDDMARVWGANATALWAGAGIAVDAATTWDIATLAVAKEYRGRGSEGLISLALYQALLMTAVACGARWFVTVLDLVVLDLIETRCGRPFSYFPGVEPLRYLDSPASLPVYVDIPDYARRLAASDPTMHSLFFEGSGLEEAVLIPDWERVARDAHAQAAAIA